VGEKPRAAKTVMTRREKNRLKINRGELTEKKKGEDKK